MQAITHKSSLNENICSVKSPVNTQLPLFSSLMIHHKRKGNRNYQILSYKDPGISKRYGVSPSRRILSPGLLCKRFDQVVDCLKDVVGITVGQREVTLEMLRLWAYYGQVYPKASHFGQQPGSSRATFWRTIKVLRDLNLVTVVNRFVLRPHAQISNLYKLDKLLILIARYLAEHGVAFYKKWLKPYLTMPGSQFWDWAHSPILEEAGCCLNPYPPNS